MDKSKRIFVYDDFSEEYPILMGYLFVDFIRGDESYSFEYEDEWLSKNLSSIPIDPDLQVYKGRQYPNGVSIFGAFSDASPDRWGQMLINKREKLIAAGEHRKPRKMNASDFLLGVYDETRMGGLRFKLDNEGDFLSEDEGTAVPPWTSLRTLEEASRRYEENDTEILEKWIMQLIKPGSSLGGARPKATVVDSDGYLWIAKFPSKHDEYNIGSWEKVASDLAKLCNLDVPESRLETFSRLGSTFLVKRFDRTKERRIHFASAMTLLRKTDGASSQDGTGYLDIASFIKSNGYKPREDLIELWKRIVFNMAITNSDDHLRNHAFIYNKKGWKLSPLFDVNPVPYGEELSLNVSENDNSISFELAVEIAPKFGIDVETAKTTVKDMSEIIRNNWKNLAIQYGISRSEIENMKTAFTECYKDII